jgi:hypothetical protein
VPVTVLQALHAGMETPWDAGTYNWSSEPDFTAVRCWLEERPTYPNDLAAFVPTSILAGHLARLPAERRERFVAGVVAGVRLPLDYVRLNVSAVRGPN